MKQNGVSVLDARMTNIAENSVKKYLQNMGQIAVVAENSVKSSLKDLERNSFVSEINIPEDKVEATKDTVSENDILISNIRKSAEDCLRNFLQKNHSLSRTNNNNDVLINITNQEPNIDNIIEPMSDITSNDVITNENVNETVSNTNNANENVNEPVSNTNNANENVNESVSNTDVNINETAPNTNNDAINDYDDYYNSTNETVSNTNNKFTSNDTNVNKTISSSTNVLRNSAIIENTAILTELAKIAEKSVRNIIIKMPFNIRNGMNETSSLQKSKQDIIKIDNKQVPTDRNNDKVIDTIDTTSNMSSLPQLQATIKTNTTEQTDKLVSSLIDKSPTDNDLKEISKTAVDKIINFIGTNNDMIDATTNGINDPSYDKFERERSSVDDKNSSEESVKEQSEMGKVHDARSKLQTLPVYEFEEPSHDASITIYDVNNDDTKNEMTEKTYLSIDTDNTDKFVMRKRP